MKREIKFRGKRADNGEWVYGSLDLSGDKPFMSWREVDSDGDTVPWFAAVQEETISQFTGLTDCNGKEIYEGDIIKDENGVVYEICWYDDLASFMAEMMCNERLFMISDIGTKYMNVIGNIHDNPELMKGGN